MTDVTVRDASNVIERVIIEGDLSKLSAPDRIAYYRRVCESIGVNPFTKPFDYITLNGKLTLYAKRDCTDQLRKMHNLSVGIVSRERIEDIYVVTARGTLPNGRVDESIGAVSLGGLKGDALANAIMKAETKAKRRVTLSIVGLGWLDETEVETISDARPTVVDASTGEIKGASAGMPEPTNGNGAGGWAAWTEAAHKGFWAKANKLGLDKDAVHAEFGVASMTDYRGSQPHAAVVLQVLEDGIGQGLTVEQIHQALKIERADLWASDLAIAQQWLDAYTTEQSASNKDNDRPF
jgi:hypothetical protein